MIQIEQADLEIKRALVPTTETETLPLAQTLQRTLARPVCADRPYPPFDRVAMDGVAFKFSEWEKRVLEFTVAFTHGAGEPPRALGPGPVCAEVMTGAILPEGADVVVPFERLDRRPSEGSRLATLRADEEIVLRQNIHLRGSDCAEGIRLLEEGMTLTPPRLAVAASVGVPQLEVYRQPRIALVSTGDELVAVEQIPESYQIRSSNVQALQGLFHGFWFTNTALFHVADEEALLQRRLATLLEEFDFIVLSGGVSMGTFDYVPKVLERLKVECVFHKVAQKPGKPLWFGMGPRKQVVFGLPGNPVSSLVCARRFVVPSLRQWAHAPERAIVRVKLGEELHFEKPLTWLPAVHLNGEGIAHTTRTNGSGDFVSLIQSDGFLELPAGTSHFALNQAYPFFGWGPSTPWHP